MKRKVSILLLLIAILCAVALPVYAASTASADDAVPASTTEQKITQESESSLLGDKAIAAGIAITLAAGLGGLGMGIATGKAAEGISRQPEAEGKIRTTFMLGLVFIETAIIYALLVVILIIFVI